MATELTVQSERAFQKQPHSEFFFIFSSDDIGRIRGGWRLRGWEIDDGMGKPLITISPRSLPQQQDQGQVRPSG